MASSGVTVQPPMTTGSLARVDGSLIPKSQIGTDVYQNVRLVRQSTDSIRGDSGSRKIIFAPPNSGLLNLRSLSIFADFQLDAGGFTGGAFPFLPNDGSVWKWDGSGSDPEPCFAPDTKTNTVFTTNVGQGLSDPFFCSLIERIVVSAGGTPIVDTRDLNVVNHKQLKLGWNSEFLIPQTSTYQGYDADNKNRVSGVPGSGYWEYPERMQQTQGTRFYQLQSTPEPIQMEPFMFENAFFNSSDGVLPLQLMPNVTIEIYFASSETVLSQYLPVGYRYAFNPSAITGRLNYYMANIRLECLMAGSNSLEKALISQGMSMTYRDYAHHTKMVNTIVKGPMSFQIPVTQRCVEKVFIIVRREDYLRDITKSGKLSYYIPTARIIDKANIRINGIRRYGEDLDSREAFVELQRLVPKSKVSQLFQDAYRDWNACQQVVVFSAQMDYSRELISGIKTASQTSPLIVDIQWVSQWNSENAPVIMDVFVQYVKWVSVTREQLEVID